MMTMEKVDLSNDTLGPPVQTVSDGVSLEEIQIETSEERCETTVK